MTDNPIIDEVAAQIQAEVWDKFGVLIIDRELWYHIAAQAIRTLRDNVSEEMMKAGFKEIRIRVAGHHCKVPGCRIGAITASDRIEPVFTAMLSSILPADEDKA